jgi:hypothetical protein
MIHLGFTIQTSKKLNIQKITKDEKISFLILDNRQSWTLFLDRNINEKMPMTGLTVSLHALSVPQHNKGTIREI